MAVHAPAGGRWPGRLPRGRRESSRASLASRATTYPTRECRAIFSRMGRPALAAPGRMIGLSPNRATKRTMPPAGRPRAVDDEHSSARGPSSVDADARAGAALDPGRPRWAHGAHLGPGGSHDLWRHARFDWPSVDWNHDRFPPLQRPASAGGSAPRRSTGVGAADSAAPEPQPLVWGGAGGYGSSESGETPEQLRDEARCTPTRPRSSIR